MINQKTSFWPPPARFAPFSAKSRVRDALNCHVSRRLIRRPVETIDITTDIHWSMSGRRGGQPEEKEGDSRNGLHNNSIITLTQNKALLFFRGGGLWAAQSWQRKTSLLEEEEEAEVNNWIRQYVMQELCRRKLYDVDQEDQRFSENVSLLFGGSRVNRERDRVWSHWRRLRKQDRAR